MGLCPDCSAEGETVTYVGASRSDIVDGVEADGNAQAEEDDTKSDVELAECDLCGDKYSVDDGSESDE